MKSKRSWSQRLAGQQALFGFAQVHPSPVLSEMAGRCGYDFLMLDGEHGTFTEQDYLTAFMATAASDMAVFVRVRGHDYRAIGQYLDLGADGIMAPNVETAEQAQALLRAMEYPPLGTRGFAATAHRASSYGADLPAHIKSPRGHAFLIVQIESALGVRNVEQILSLAGVDAAVIGVNDLSADLGGVSDFSMPAFKEAVAQIERAAVRHGKVLGFGVPGEPLEASVARGYRLISLAHDVCSMHELLAMRLAEAKTRLGEESR